MKKSILALVLCTTITGSAFAQNQQNADLPHKVGLIDMAYIFKNYQKFTDLREDLKKEIQNSDAKAKSMATQIKSLQEKLKDPKYKKDSPEVKSWRTQSIQLMADYQNYRQEQQQKFLKQEAEIYKTVYLEVADAVKTYAEYYKYTLIIRWNREGVDKAKDAKEILGRMNRIVIFAQQGNDITDVILRYLNGEYQKKIQQAGGTRRRD